MDGGSMVINMSATAANATCMAGGGSLLHPGMELHATTAPSPIGFAATMSVAMELENKLKAETVEGFPLPCRSEGSKSAFEDGVRLEDSCQDGGGGGKLEDRLGRKRDHAVKMEDHMESSLPLDEELMDEDDDGESIGHSSGSDGNVSYADISPGMPGTESLKGDMELDEDMVPLQKLHNALGRNGLQMGADSSAQRSLNGRPDSSEGDYYDGGVSESSQTQSYHRQLNVREDSSGGNNLDNGEELYQCHLCSFTANSKFQFHAHVNSHYNHKCNHCDYTSRTEGRLKRHLKDFHSDLPLEAFSPGSVVKGDGESNGNSQSKAKTYRCKQCSFVATVKLDFWEHSKMHIKAEKLLTCPKCPFVTEYKHHLEYHLRNHFGSKPFKCPKCNYSCVNKSMLNSHMKSHSNIYQYRCANCTYATKYCHSLKLHLRKYAHTPSTVLNMDGTPNPMPVIDVYGTRRGPRNKKSQEDAFGGSAGGNGGTGGSPMPFSPMQLPSNGALSPASTVLPFFYPGASGPLSNGFHSSNKELHVGNITKPSVTSAGNIGTSSGGSAGGVGTITRGKEEELPDNKRHQPPNSGPASHKCNLCEFATDHRELFAKHMLLHAAAENQDLCNLYGIGPDGVSQADSNQQQTQMNAAAMAAVVAALGLSNPSHRAEVFRHYPLASLQAPTNQEGGHGFECCVSPVQEAVKALKPPADNRAASPPQPHPPAANPLENLRAFSEQVNVKPFMMREFSSNLFPSAALPNCGTHANFSANGASSQSALDERRFLNGRTSPKVSPTSHRKIVPKASKDDAIPDEKSVQMTEGITSLGPLDLSSAKLVHRHRLYHHPMQHPYVQQQLIQQHYNLSVMAAQQTPPAPHPLSTQGFLEISTDVGSMQGHSPTTEEVSPTQAKNRRKGRAFKLDRICLKLQKERGSPGHPSSGHTDDSMEDGDASKISDTGDDSAKPELHGDGNVDDGAKDADVMNKKPIVEAECATKMQCLQQDSKKSPSSAKHCEADQSKVDNVHSSPTSNVNDDSSNWKEAYECQYCDMAFKDCIMYTVHMGYHGFKDPYKCNMCGQQTKDKVAFFLHIARTAHL